MIRALPMSALELTEEWFESDAVRAAIAAVAVHGATLGPMSAGTGYTLMHNWLNRGGPGHRRVEGGIGRIADALVAALKARGGEIRLSAAVKTVLVDDQRARGVRLTNGEEIPAPLMISAADPRHTLLDLVGAPELPPEFVWHTQSIKMRGSVAKVHLLTDGNHGLPKGTLVVAPSVRYARTRLRRGQVRRDVDAALFGNHHRRPRGLAAFPIRALRLAPRRLGAAARRCWSAPPSTRRRARSRNSNRASAKSKSLTPLDLEKTYGLTEGDLNHGQLILDQMFFMRPMPGWSNHKTPIDGLYLCGNGVHGGGGLSGAAAATPRARC